MLRQIARSIRLRMGELRYERFKVAQQAAAAALSSKLEQQAYQAQRFWDLGEPEKAVAGWEALAKAQPLEPQWPLKLVNAADMRADLLEAERIANAAWSRGIRSRELEERVVHFKRWNRVSNSAVEDAVAVVRDPQASSLMIFKSVGYLLSENMLEPAREGLARIADLSEFQGTGKTLMTTLEILEQQRAEGRKPTDGFLSPTRDVIFAPEPGADTTVIAFTTILGDCGLTVNALHALLQPLKVNGIYIFDEKKLYNLDGSTTLGRPYPAMLESLRAQLKAWGTKTVITTGFSLGGYTALRVGLDLKADGAFLISPLITTLRPPELPIELIAQGNERRMAYLETHMRKHVLPMMTLLADELDGRTCLPLIEIHRGTNFFDMVHTAYVEGKEGVEIHEVSDFTRHECLTEIIRRGDPDVVGRFVERVRALH